MANGATLPPLTVEDLNSHLTALQTALASTVTSIQRGDTKVQYRTVAELKTALGAVNQNLVTVAATAATIRTFRFTSSKDL